MTVARLILGKNPFRRYEMQRRSRCVATMATQTLTQVNKLPAPASTIAITNWLVPRKLNPSALSLQKSSKNISCSFPIAQTKRGFFGLFDNGNSLAEVLLSENSGEANKQCIDYSGIQPDQIRKAADILKEKYESEVDAFDKAIGSDATFEDVMPELERISRPLSIFQNIITLFSCVKKDSTMSGALHEANDTVKNTRKLTKNIINVMVQIEQQLEGDKSKEEDRRAVNRWLRKERINGSMIDNEEVQQQVYTIQERLTQTQARFVKRSSLTVEEHGTVAAPQELIPMMYEIVALQQHLAKLLGYKSYAAYCLEYHNAMAKSAEEIEAVHNLFEQQGAVEKFSSDDFQSAYLNLTSSPDSVDFKDYLELNSVLKGLFSFCTKMFGIVIEEDENHTKGWHRDVRLFHVLEENADSMDKKKVASFYFDPYRRLHKDFGCFMTPIQYKNNNCTPIVAISMDIRPPVWDDTAVGLDVKNVVDLYHEFGHALQHMLADVSFGEYSGAQMMEEDSSETISQFMEYWLFEGNGILELGTHKDTGECIPQEAFEKVQMKRKATKANDLLQRLFLGSMELELNSKFNPNGEESIIALQRNNALRYCPHLLPSKGNIDSLIELFQNDAFGKRTMQYRYLWSEISSADIFAAFLNKKGDLKTEAELKEIGTHLRDEVLKVGASKSAADAFASYRGRNAEIIALLSKYELLK